MIDNKTLGDAMNEVQSELDDLVSGKGDVSKLPELKDKVARMRSQIEASGTNSVFSGHLQNATAKLAAFDPTFSGVPVPLGPVAVSPGGVHDPTNPSYVVSPNALSSVPSAAKADAPQIEEAPETAKVPPPEPPKAFRAPSKAPEPGTTGTFGSTGFTSSEGGDEVKPSPVPASVSAPAAGKLGSQPQPTGAAVAGEAAQTPWDKK